MLNNILKVLIYQSAISIFIWNNDCLQLADDNLFIQHFGIFDSIAFSQKTSYFLNVFRNICKR